jgi:hypothetical protein
MMPYVVAAFLAVLTFAFLVYAAVRWTRPGSPGVAWLFASFSAAMRAALGLGMTARRFPPPWTVEEANNACFVGRQSRPHC